MHRKITLFISAGEVSGDRHGAALVRELKALDPTLNFIGMGSDAMASEGVRLLADLTPFSTIGILEPLFYLPRIIKTYFKLKKSLSVEKPDGVVVIDYQGFHMLLLKAVKKLGIKSVYYIAPQEWQWGTEKGGQDVVSVVDKILAIFPKEAEFYTRLGGHVRFVGHPILDLAVNEMSRETFCRAYGLNPDRRIIAVFPGSRSQELIHTAPILLEGAKALKTLYPDIQIVVSVASQMCKQRILDRVAQFGLEGAAIVEGKSYALMAHSDFSFCTSGTVTLEHAVLGTPCIVGYRFSAVSYAFLTTFFRKKIAHISYMSLPNIVANDLILPEFLQDQLTVEALVRQATLWLENVSQYRQTKEKLRHMTTLLGERGVVKRAAVEIVKLF